jgi:hypothetical protein
LDWNSWNSSILGSGFGKLGEIAYVMPRKCCISLCCCISLAPTGACDSGVPTNRLPGRMARAMAKAKPPLVRWALFRKQTKPAVSFQATAFSSPNWAPFPATLPGWSSRFQAPWGGDLGWIWDGGRRSRCRLPRPLILPFLFLYY